MISIFLFIFIFTALQEYNYGKFPLDAITIDGFICVCDVTEVPKRNFQTQLNEINQILNNLIKTKKPIVVVTTKNDYKLKYKQEFVDEFDKLLASKKEYHKFLYMQIIETSSHLNINVNLPFFILAMLINNKLSKNRVFSNQISQIPKFGEAFSNYSHLNTELKNYLHILLKNEVTDYKFKYEQFHTIKHKELKQLIDFFGIDFIINQFNLHASKLKQELINKKLCLYLKRLSYLIEIFYESSDIDKKFYLNNTWAAVQENMKKREFFGTYVVKSEDTAACGELGKSTKVWYENDYFDKSSLVIPYEVFQSNECRIEFENYVKSIKDLNKKNEYKSQLLNLLHATAANKCIQPGKHLSEVNVYLIGRECYEYLNEEERKTIYDKFQKEIYDKAKNEYKELLNENIELFLKKILDNTFNYKTVTVEDIEELNNYFKRDSRHQILDKLSEERKGLLLKQVAFLMNKAKSNCSHASGFCIDMHLVKYLEEKYRIGYEKFFITQFQQVKSYDTSSLLLAIQNFQFNCLLASSSKSLTSLVFEKIQVTFL